MRTNKNRNRNVPNPVARGFPSFYEPSFKKAVILFAEQKNNQEAHKRFGIPEETIRRWRKQKKEILAQADQSIRRSQRRHRSFQDSSQSLQSKSREDAVEGSGSIDLDSMPLQQRLSQSFNQEPFAAQLDQDSFKLQSLALSPTKLKVTRQGKSSAPPPVPQVSPPQEVCLKWNTHHINMQSAFPTLLTKGQYVDATLVAEGRTLKCHKMILSSCSPYFEEVMNGIGPLEHPVLFMNSPYWVLEALCAFMYAGEVNIKENQLSDLLDAAASLKIKGLATPNQPNASGAQPIKQEVCSSTPTAASEKAMKEEKDEEIKLAKHDLKSSKKKEDRRTKHASQPAKAKPPEVPLLKLSPRLSAAAKTMGSAIKPLAKPLPKSVTTRAAVMARRADPGRKTEKYKPEASGLKENDRDTTRPVLRKGNINDPLDLLQPVYEEIAKVPRTAAAILKNAREKAGVTIRKTVGRRVKKRKHEQVYRDESPPPDLQSLKGTRSRPQAKVPKFFHSHFDDSLKDPAEATIVREPHTEQHDPLIGVEVQEIKAEPLDVDDNVLELEEGSLATYMVPAQEMGLEGEEIIGNYDSPLVNIKREPIKSGLSKKELHPSPVIVDVHTVAEGDGGLLTIKKEKVEIVDIAKISARIESETFISTPVFDSGPGQPKPSQIIISHVQSMAEENLPQLLENQSHPIEIEPLAPDPSLPSEPDPLDLHETPAIPNSTTENSPSTACRQTTDNSESQPEFVVLQNHQQSNNESGSLGSLEGHLELVNLSESSIIESSAVEKTVEQPAATEAPDSTEDAVAEPNIPSKLQVEQLQACEEPTAALTEPPLEEWASQETTMEPMVISQNSEPCELLAQSNCLAEENAASPKSVEKIDKIEAELEECLASTSDLASGKPMSFEDNEDFSKDIEFSTFITKNNYLDYDFVTDVDMEGKNDSQTQKLDEQQVLPSKPEGQSEEAKSETLQNEDRLNPLGNSEDFPGCAEDAQQFLADLDSDIIMDSVTGQRQPDGPEKTLEMIVNDLSESLGE